MHYEHAQLHTLVNRSTKRFRMLCGHEMGVACLTRRLAYLLGSTGKITYFLVLLAKH